ncbi:unnamed protein product [Macrosiphum euphorbiae]|uniref:Transposable element P transposase n=1 Tax=Macrosiphum euphorbiae TaxID=13131 RepID=A0AAV0XEX2_9HEMI|nr:unnamed protein product [Macrosiphum euphorbiae]CAI6366117.1 unnamed protein product [Macrosiphum euphorbiae]
MTAAGAIFTQLQIRETHNKAKGRRFTMEEKLLSLSLYKQSKKSYRLLSKLFTLPSRKTLSSLLSKIPIKTGLDETFLKVLGENVKHLKKKDKFCVILFDEVSLEAQLHYDHNVGNIMGFEDNGLGRTQNFADHSLVFMIKGITKKYKQPMSYTFCQSSTNKHDLANQIRKVIQAVTSVGLKVVATICDQGTSNSAAIRVLHNYTKEYYLRRNENNYDDNFYEIQCGDERVKVIHLYDSPHLIKGIRNNLLNKNLVCTINGERKEARWQDIIDLYELDNNIQEVRMLPRLTREHVIPNEIRKMKVKNACQVLSQRVAAILNFLASRDIMDVKAKDTADICLFFDQIFDSVNGNFHKVVDGKVYRTAVTKNSPHHQLWRNAIKVMETMHFVDSVTKQKCKSQPPTIKNWILTLKGFQNVVKVMNANGVHSLLLRNFNQDPLENMFGALRALGYRNNNPNCQMFASSYRTLVLNNFLSSHSPGSNCEDDQGNSGLMSFQTLFDAYSKEMLEAEVTEPLQDRVADGKLRKKPQTEITHAQLEHQTNTYIAGYICKKLNTVFIKDCSKCLKEICTSTPTEQHDLVKNRDYQLNGKLNLKYPNTTFCQLVQNTIDIIYKHLPSICHHSSLKCELVKIINTTIDTNIVSCTTHKSEFGKRFVEFAIKLFVHNWCTHINRILAGKMYINSKESDQIKILASARYKKFSKRPQFRKK